jgi:hypothetical protein
MKKSNLGTDAKTIALHYLNATTDGRHTPAVFAKTINQAKSLLNSGYTVDEICGTIDYVIKQGVNMYSIGYINAVIGDVVKELNKEHVQRAAEQEKKLMMQKERETQSEVKADVESTERNREKATRLSVQSGLRTKYLVDMFERDGQNH